MSLYDLAATHDSDWVDSVTRAIVVFGSEGWGFESLRARHDSVANVKEQCLMMHSSPGRRAMLDCCAV